MSEHSAPVPHPSGDHGRSEVAEMPLADECDSCADPSIPGSTDGAPRNECPRSKRPCGHHCNCSWTQDRCHWCGVEFGEADA